MRGLLVVAPLQSGSVCLAAGLNTTATKDDWEEINFAFDSAVPSDGYSSLLRLADPLKNNPKFHVKLAGHTDAAGKREPKVENRTGEGRFMNRRVSTTVTDDKGKVDSAVGSVGDAIRSMEKQQQQPDVKLREQAMQKGLDDCCSEIR